MSSVNVVVLTGYLGADPKKMLMPSGNSVANFNIATNDVIKGKEGKITERTDWHKVSVWGKVADACSELLHKGSKVLVRGKLRNNEYIDKEGHKKYSYEIFARDIKFISNYGEKEIKNKK